MERSPWIFMSAGKQKQAAKISKMFWAGVMSQTVSGRKWRERTLCCEFECNDMQWYAMAWTGVLAWISLVPGHCIRTHAHAVFEECQVFLKYACFIIIVMHFLTVSSIFFIASFHHISIYIICDRIYINLRYYMLTIHDCCILLNDVDMLTVQSTGRRGPSAPGPWRLLCGPLPRGELQRSASFSSESWKITQMTCQLIQKCF